MPSSFADVVEQEEMADGGYDLTHGNVIQGDTLSVLPKLPENEFHAVVCDPPYNFDDGFMQQEWDDVGSSTEYQRWCEQWAEKALNTLKPGGHLIAFSSNTSHHRLMSGVEDAGYEIRDTITWHYGNGFPKGQQIERWLDDEYTDEFGDWRGLLKPATEFAVLARAPLEGTSSTKNQMKHGVGNLNVEACRIESEERPKVERNVSGDTGNTWEGGVDGSLHGSEFTGTTDEGRFPPNLALDSVMADVMDLQSGQLEADSGGASRFFYCSKASTSERTHDGDVDNDHPTVKPVDLMEWLVKMVTAEGQKVLDPFTGSGTTMVASENVNRKCVGIEMNDEYVEIAEQRFNAVAD